MIKISEVYPAELYLATESFASMWTAMARAGGRLLADRPGFLACGPAEPGTPRILLRSGTPGADEVAELTALAAAWRADGGEVVVEDPFSALTPDPALGLTPRQLPVMIRYPKALDRREIPGVTVRRVDAASLATAERVIVEGFPLEPFAPYVPAQAFPPAMLDQQGTGFFLAEIDGVAAGACLTVGNGQTLGVYWMSTLPEHRSRGVGRALMYAVLDLAAGLPVALVAAKPGRPLYESLGFDLITHSTWWA
ncbi:GNAT family N-acetyltransferase [Longispora albida]|uniref:GNAT family N-acetyltransferase n=1 Tax=Longispora albida TaxID=203523 RepID=UPI0003792852|nr:GNAT family N-acetyltransferase [Longispora albida]